MNNTTKIFTVGAIVVILAYFVLSRPTPIETEEVDNVEGFCIDHIAEQSGLLFQRLDQQMTEKGFTLKTTRGGIVGCSGKNKVFYEYESNT